MNFNDKKMPEPNIILKPKEKKVKKEQPHIQRLKKQSIVNIEGLEELKKLEEQTLQLIKEQEALSLAEQILRRQQEEQENKRKEILKQLHKPKNIDIKKFLTRTIGYEQKKNFDLEQRRFKKLEEETKLCKDIPLISTKTEQICQNLNKKPIYQRTNEIIEKKEKNLRDLKKKDYTFSKRLRGRKNNKNKNRNKKMNNSMDNIIFNNTNNSTNEKERKKKEYIINEKTKNRKMNIREMSDYYQRQNEWKKNIEKKIKMKENTQKKNKTKEFGKYFHPKISQGTIEIINEKNKVNENNKYQNIEVNNNNNNHYYIKDDTYENKINLKKNVYDRLYEENAVIEMKKNQFKNKSACIFQPFINKNKYKQIRPKYNQININKKKKNRTRNNRNFLRGAKTVEVGRKKNEIIESIDKGKINTSMDKGNFKKNKNIKQPWINLLLRLKEDNSNKEDFSYRLNIRQGSAWNENDVNTVPYRGRSLDIVKYFI